MKRWKTILCGVRVMAMLPPTRRSEPGHISRALHHHLSLAPTPALALDGDVETKLVS